MVYKALTHYFTPDAKAGRKSNVCSSLFIKDSNKPEIFPEIW
jgi:hypothetical protein